MSKLKIFWLTKFELTSNANLYSFREMESSIYYVLLEGLKQIHSFFPPEENSTALGNLIKVTEELEQMLQNKWFNCS